VIENASLAAILANVPRVFSGRLDGSRLYRRLAVTSALVTASAAFPYHRDGEPEDPVFRLEIGLLPKALRLLVPRAVASDPDGPLTPTV
jgi:diacylglycerol kinase family enzyme